MPIPEDFPQPVLIEDPESQNNTDALMDPEVEETFSCGSYFLSSAQDPNSSASVYGTNTRFTVAMLNQSTTKRLQTGETWSKNVS